MYITLVNRHELLELTKNLTLEAESAPSTLDAGIFLLSVLQDPLSGDGPVPLTL